MLRSRSTVKEGERDEREINKERLRQPAREAGGGCERRVLRRGEGEIDGGGTGRMLSGGEGEAGRRGGKGWEAGSSDLSNHADLSSAQ